MSDAGTRPTRSGCLLGGAVTGMVGVAWAAGLVALYATSSPAVGLPVMLALLQAGAIYGIAERSAGMVKERGGGAFITAGILGAGSLGAIAVLVLASCYPTGLVQGGVQRGWASLFGRAPRSPAGKCRT